MHIVHVTHRVWPIVGGAEQYVLEIARRQVTDGHKVVVVATLADSLDALWRREGRRLSPDTPSSYAGVHIDRLPLRYLPSGGLTFPVVRRLTWFLSHVSPWAASWLGRLSPWVPALSDTLQRMPVDLFFAWNLTFEALTMAVAQEAVRRQVPWVSVPLLHLGQPKLYAMPHQMALLHAADRVVAQTEFERDYLIRRGCTSGRIVVASPGVAESSIERCQRIAASTTSKGERPRVLMLGYLVRDKGAPHVIDAACCLWGRGLTFDLFLVGVPGLEVRRAVAKLPQVWQDRCHLVGPVSEELKWQYLASADVVAYPSRTESFGMVFLEAWACGKPVIGARAGAVAEVVEDGRDGLLVEFGDVAGLAEALRSLLLEPARAQEMGRRGCKKVFMRYTWTKQFERWRRMVNELMERWHEERL